MTPYANAKEYEYFIVALTKHGKLVSGYVTARSFSYAYDKFLDSNDLIGQVHEYRFCVRKDRSANGSD